LPIKSFSAMINSVDDTIYAPATIPGTGAITLIRVSGKDTLSIVDKVVKCRKSSLSDSPANTIKFGTIYSEGKPLDEVLVSVFKAPHSYTGEDSAEITCHASSYICSQIMTLLSLAGGRAAGPGEFTERAFVNGKMDLAEAEAVADLISAQNEAAHRVAFNQLKGGFSKELASMRADLLNITSLMELELDFSEEEVEFADRKKLNDLLDKVLYKVNSLAFSFKLGNAIKNGIPVAIVGATNTGKSTLLNALLGEDRAIVSDIAGTTRDTIEETLNLDGILFRFIDTAGIRTTEETIEKIGIERTFRKISEAQIVLGLLDMTRSESEIFSDAQMIFSKVDLKSQKLVFLLNKEDIFEVNKNVSEFNKLVSLIENKYNNSISFVNISAKTGEGLIELKRLLSDSQKELLAENDAVLVTNIRHYEALTKTAESLSRVKAGLAQNIPTDLVSQDLREALYHLGTIVGEVTTDEVLGNIFEHFCIGK
jgi:tRNA modification GTPase